MKTIVAPTDFSASAEHATLYAAGLAKAINATLLLLHVYQLPIMMNDFPVLIISAEDLKKNADDALNIAREALQKTVSDVTVETQSMIGDVVEGIKDSCSDRDVAAVVIGASSLNGLEKFLLGNTTLSIVTHCPFPVFTVPSGAELKLPRKIALATDLSGKDTPVQTIEDMVNLLKAELQVVHVEVKGEEVVQNDLVRLFKNAEYHSVKEDDVTLGLEHFVTQNHIDLLLVLPHKHNLFERLFSKGHTEGLLRAMPIPVLCLHHQNLSGD